MVHIAVQDPTTELTAKGGVPYLTLTADERADVAALAAEVVDDFGTTDPAELEQRLNDIALYAHRMPERLRAVLTGFRLTGEPQGGLVLSGLPVEEDSIGPTPDSYAITVEGSAVTRATAVLLLVGSLLGDPFSYLSQQRGRLVLDVFPIKGHEGEQLGSSSTTLLEWHNEDAFHPDRADWIMLLCLRNPDAVPTMFAPAQGLELDDDSRKVLFEDRFVILPDESHTAQFNVMTTGVDNNEAQAQAFARIASMYQEHQRTSILSGDPESPYVQIDPAFMVRELDDDAAEKALEVVIEAFEKRMQDVALGPGELLIVDNKRAVHGRRPFRARYDGTDRWLRRINISADLRRSAGRRFGSHGRAVV
ncbi:guanitoxin biosynthesis L-enduracididine beta-hydroxylase GntD [Actinoplanes sp. NEAU-A12]|uniref:Guanitoxin biosynthesis L-enduracididine beta-hydroxylase GntD n=1 Tax=Actinoplanes sandaracinus TaxID=3045177 RepID=A0ABT6X1W9_9ACTN|nr:guanitoxin biosynthesis L-enduracididine beta-hydroxylase GntD [Actinoplanes sandaracinus]MDI6105990.1 guanitoxin biosynthesis L-enduracididine beta-hydroxylase GntD [Actinoplanes sandaracinus]